MMKKMIFLYDSKSIVMLHVVNGSFTAEASGKSELDRHSFGPRGLLTFSSRSRIDRVKSYFAKLYKVSPV